MISVEARRRLTSMTRTCEPPALVCAPVMTSAIPIARRSLPATRDAAGEGRVVGVEAGELREIRPVETDHADVGAARRPGTGDDFGDAVTRRVSRRHMDAAEEGGVVGVEAGELREACLRAG